MLALTVVLVAAAGVIPLARLPGAADQELLQRFRSGDRRAFDEIVLRYQHRVYTLCYRWLGEREAAEDVAQDVFLAVFRSLEGFRGDASLSTWIYKVAVNHCRNRRLYRFRRGHGRHDPLGPPVDEETPERQLADESATADAGSLRREARDLVQAALEAVDEDHRQILILRDVEDLDYEEIADILDIPRGTVKSRLHRARVELAGQLARRARPEDLR